VIVAYAEGTLVSVERSKYEIETLLKKYGADQFASGWRDGRTQLPTALAGAGLGREGKTGSGRERDK
jgi:hypothetical protein